MTFPSKVTKLSRPWTKLGSAHASSDSKFLGIFYSIPFIKESITRLQNTFASSEKNAQYLTVESMLKGVSQIQGKKWQTLGC